MKIQIASDLHNEFGMFEMDFSGIDLLILAGDIDIGEKGVSWIANELHDVPVIYVLGNHEYYRNAYPKLLSKLKLLTENTNIHILEQESIEVQDISFHGTTFWTDFRLFGNPKVAGIEAQLKMNDYKLIRRDPSYSRLRSIDTFNMHYQSLKWLEQSLKESTTEKNVVITHHAPSLKSVPEHYKNDLITAAYTSDLDDFVNEVQADLWIHGHLHSCSDYMIGKTRIICNPRGYPDEPDEGFNDRLIIEIGE